MSKHESTARQVRTVGLATGWAMVGLVLLLASTARAQTETAPAGVIPEMIDLRPTGWVAGQTSRYEFWNLIQNTVETRFGDRQQTQRANSEITGELTWTVETVRPDGSATCTMTLDWMLIKTEPVDERGKSLASPNVVDSRKKPTDEAQKPMYELLSAMADVPVKVEVAPDGHITEVSNLKAMKAKTSQPDFLPSASDFQESATDLATVVYAPPAFAYSPSAGPSWKADFTWDHDHGEMQQKWNYRFDRVEDIAGVPVAVVSGEAKVKLIPDLSKRPAGAPPMNIKLLDGSAETQVLFDLTRHEAIGRSMNLSERIEMSVAFPDGRQFRQILSEVTSSQTLRIEEE